MRSIRKGGDDESMAPFFRFLPSRVYSGRSPPRVTRYGVSRCVHDALPGIDTAASSET
jgi:hypothetical protein